MLVKNVGKYTIHDTWIPYGYHNYDGPIMSTPICQADWVFGSCFVAIPTTPTEETFSLRHGTHGHGAEATDGEGTQLDTSAVGGYGAGTFSTGHLDDGWQLFFFQVVQPPRPTKSPV